MRSTRKHDGLITVGQDAHIEPFPDYITMKRFTKTDTGYEIVFRDAGEIMALLERQKDGKMVSDE